MKLKACLCAAAVATKVGHIAENPKVRELANKAAKKVARQLAKSFSDESVNVDSCIYTEQNGITSITTEPGLTQMTKCYKRFQCNDGAKVQARINEVGLGTYWSNANSADDCKKNFFKFEYSIPRDDFQDFYHWTDHICDKDELGTLELGKWMTMESSVQFSFEWSDHDEFYAWYYPYTEWLYDYYADYDPHPYPGYPAKKYAKFDISFKCSNVPDEPDTTTPIPEPTVNPNYNKIEQIIGDWQEMLKKFIEEGFNKLATKLNDRHQKMLDKGCTFKKMTEQNVGKVHIDYENTCEAITTVVNDLMNWGTDYVYLCEGAKSSVMMTNGLWWNRYVKQLQRFQDKNMKFTKCPAVQAEPQ